MSRTDYRSAVLVATRCPGCGKVAVTSGDTLLARIDLGAAKLRKKQAISLGSWAKPRSGRITVTVLTKGKDVVLEGIGFSARR